VEYVFGDIMETKLGLFAEAIITCSSGRRMLVEASVAEAGRIRLKARTMESRADRGIFLFLFAASCYPERLFNFDFPFNFGPFLRLCPAILAQILW
jgi:hypothetical protein